MLADSTKITPMIVTAIADTKAHAEAVAAKAKSAAPGSVVLIVGHSHSFDAPYLRAREHIAAGIYGSVQMIHALNYTDFLYRPRRTEELDTSKGGGVVFSQGAHQVDIVRLLGGGRARKAAIFPHE